MRQRTARIASCGKSARGIWSSARAVPPEAFSDAKRFPEGPRQRPRSRGSLITRIRNGGCAFVWHATDMVEHRAYDARAIVVAYPGRANTILLGRRHSTVIQLRFPAVGFAELSHRECAAQGLPTKCGTWRGNGLAPKGFVPFPHYAHLRVGVSGRNTRWPYPEAKCLEDASNRQYRVKSLFEVARHPAAEARPSESCFGVGCTGFPVFGVCYVLF